MCRSHEVLEEEVVVGPDAKCTHQDLCRPMCTAVGPDATAAAAATTVVAAAATRRRHPPPPPPPLHSTPLC